MRVLSTFHLVHLANFYTNIKLLLYSHSIDNFNLPRISFSFYFRHIYFCILILLHSFESFPVSKYFRIFYSLPKYIMDTNHPHFVKPNPLIQLNLRQTKVDRVTAAEKNHP